MYANKKLYTELVVPFPPLPEIPPVLNNKQKTLKKNQEKHYKKRAARPVLSTTAAATKKIQLP